MARRRPSPVRHRRRSRNLAVEGLEGRRLLAANVAVARDAGVFSSSVVQLIDAETGAKQAEVTAFESTFKGGVRVAMGRVTGNAAPDVVVASGSGRVTEIVVFKPVTSGGSTTLSRVLTFRPFGDTYRGGAELAVGDVDGDSNEDIVVSQSRQGGDVKVFRMTNPGGTPTQTLYATISNPFGAFYNGGASVAVADVGTFVGGTLTNAKQVDNKVEVVVGSGVGTTARALVYDLSVPATPRVADTIRPTVAPWFLGGVSVSSARYNRDFVDDVVMSTGRGGASQTFVYDGTVSSAANTLLRSFATYSGLARQNAAVYTAAVDLDGDGYTDRFMATQGDPGGVAGISVVSTAGVRTGAVTTLASPLRVAAARTFLPAQTITAVTTVASAGVPVGSTRPMQYRDVTVGTGALAENGKSLSVRYRGTLVDGTVFDPGNAPFTLVLGAGNVIKGWDAGLVGMRVGGKRTLQIPPELGYGDRGSPPNIGSGETLVFDTELLSVT